jgi:hypothetical protein
VSPFVKLFTKRVQLKPKEVVDYENAPWWERWSSTAANASPAAAASPASAIPIASSTR